MCQEVKAQLLKFAATPLYALIATIEKGRQRHERGDVKNCEHGVISTINLEVAATLKADRTHHDVKKPSKASSKTKTIKQHTQRKEVHMKANAHKAKADQCSLRAVVLSSFFLMGIVLTAHPFGV